MTLSDCFRILELPNNACLDDLKVAYRSKAKKYHPDKSGGDSRKFTLLHEAYTFLLDYGPFHSGTLYRDNSDRLRRESDERSRREAYRKAAEQRIKREAERKVAREKAKREAEEKIIREKKRKEAEKKAAERRAAYENARRRSELKAARERARKMTMEKAANERKKNTPSHQVFLAGGILNNKKTSDKDKIKAIATLISLKRKTAYPFLKEALYHSSINVKLASIEAIGKLKIIQAGPELGSLMCSGSIKIRRAIIDSISLIGKKNQYVDIIKMALNDKDNLIRHKAEALYKRLYE